MNVLPFFSPWKYPALAFEPHSFQDLCLAIDINRNIILHSVLRNHLLRVIFSPEEINAIDPEMARLWGKSQGKKKLVSRYYLQLLSSSAFSAGSNES